MSEKERTPTVSVNEIVYSLDKIYFGFSTTLHSTSQLDSAGDGGQRTRSLSKVFVMYGQNSKPRTQADRTVGSQYMKCLINKRLTKKQIKQ